jgi:hypothetical protein
MTDQEYVYNQLIEVAHAGRTVSYCEVAGWLGRDINKPEDRSEIIQILNNIAFQENAAGRPLLTAVVVRPEIGYPGMGFFLLARELGFNSDADERSYYGYELKKVHAYWKKHLPVSHTVPYMKVDQHEVRVGIS